jgi:SH3 domain.
MPFYGNAASPTKYPSVDLGNKNTITYTTMDYSNSHPLQNYQSSYDYTHSSQPYEANQYLSSYGYDNATTAPTAVTTDATVYAASVEPTVYAESNEPTYDVRRESKNQFVNPIPSDNYNPNASIFNCTYPYDPKLDDELELKINDQIQIIEEYEDGWMKAINLTTKKEGMAPIVCVKSQ